MTNIAVILYETLASTWRLPAGQLGLVLAMSTTVQFPDLECILFVVEDFKDRASPKPMTPLNM
jgi:hypothetical protein